MSYHVGISSGRESKLSEGHGLSVAKSELEPSTQDSEASTPLTTLPLERGQQGRGVCHSLSSDSSWRLFPTHLVVDCLHGDLVTLFRLDLSSDEALFLVFDPAGLLDVIGLVHGFDPLLFWRCQEGHRVHIVPTFTSVSTRHRSLAEGGAGRNQGREPGLPGCCREEQGQFARTDG